MPKKHPPIKVTAANDLPEDRMLDRTLRPRSLKEYVGQKKVKEGLQIGLTAAKKRKEALEHVLLHGAPGMGKTTLAHIIGHELGAPVRVTTGPALRRAGDLAAILTNLENGDVLFIDEMHRMNPTVEELLYAAMEEFALDLILGQGPSARTLRLDLPHFTLVGATTRMSLLTAPLRDRFGMAYRLDSYTLGDIEAIIERSAKLLNMHLAPDAASLIAARSRLTPRVANRLLKRVRDVAEVANDPLVSVDRAIEALEMLDIDERGLDETDRKILAVIMDQFRGGPVGLSAVAASVGEETDTIEEVYEPFLIQGGFLARTPRGRIATPAAYEHLKRPAPKEQQAMM
ncbi:MAG: Holliday junction branch migration DNA helicase RuvB [Candidatus Kerfeldbacteria bacterium]|nr:Holliday junction branch migration DNA helicase RuvB [Candidatus Kerfeldbacteria bacterium]